MPVSFSKWRCWQSNGNLSPNGGAVARLITIQAMREGHLANVAELSWSLSIAVHDILCFHLVGDLTSGRPSE